MTSHRPHRDIHTEPPSSEATFCCARHQLGMIAPSDCDECGEPWPCLESIAADIREHPVQPVPDIWVEEETTEDGTVVPGHRVDMSKARSQTFELVCPCGKIHGVTWTTHEETRAYPELYERGRKMVRADLVRAVAACPDRTDNKEEGPPWLR